MKRFRCSSALLLAAAVLASQRASAQSNPTASPQNAARRRDLINQANRASDAGDHATSLDLYQRAGQIQMSGSLRRYIAVEQNSLGHVVDALGSAELCVNDEQTTPSASNHIETLRACEQLVGQLESAVGRLTIEVPQPAPPGLEITVNGAPLAPSFWGIPYAVAPGSVVVRLSRPGAVSLEQRVAVSVGQVARVAVPAMPAVVAAPPVSAPPPGYPTYGSGGYNGAAYGTSSGDEYARRSAEERAAAHAAAVAETQRVMAIRGHVRLGVTLGVGLELPFGGFNDQLVMVRPDSYTLRGDVGVILRYGIARWLDFQVLALFVVGDGSASVEDGTAAPAPCGTPQIECTDGLGNSFADGSGFRSTFGSVTSYLLFGGDVDAVFRFRVGPWYIGPGVAGMLRVALLTWSRSGDVWQVDTAGHLTGSPMQFTLTSTDTFVQPGLGFVTETGFVFGPREHWDVGVRAVAGNLGLHTTLFAGYLF